MKLTDRPLFGPPPDALVRMFIKFRTALKRLNDALAPPEIAMFEGFTGVVRTMLVGEVARLGVADLLLDGPLASDEIARRTNTDADVMHRTLRALASEGVFVLRDDGRFENNRYSRVISREGPPGVKDFSAYWSSRSNIAAWSDFGETLRSGKTAFKRVHGVSVWEWFDAHPEERDAFAHAMSGITINLAPIVATVYPFAEVKRVCDVGGGAGVLLSELLIRHKHLSGVLCDAPGVLAFSEKLFEDRKVRDRVTLAPGSFFEAVPEGSDCYMLKQVLHDWDDAACEKILSTVRRAMKPGDKVLVIDAIVEKSSRFGPANLSDIHMLVACDDGRERSRSDFQRLFQATGFTPGRVFETTTVSVLEATAASP